MSELLIIRVPLQSESIVTLRGEVLVIGSNPSSHIVVNDPAILAHHAYLAKEQGHWHIVAYDAEAPIQHGGQSTADLSLEPGTRFAIGETNFEFASDSPVAAKPAACLPRRRARLRAGRAA